MNFNASVCILQKCMHHMITKRDSKATDQNRSTIYRFAHYVEPKSIYCKSPETYQRFGSILIHKIKNCSHLSCLLFDRIVFLALSAQRVDFLPSQILLKSAKTDSLTELMICCPIFLKMVHQMPFAPDFVQKRKTKSI